MSTLPTGRRLAFLALILFVLALADQGVQYGQTANWDLRNYHLYGPWAWVTGRLDIDVAPANVQGFFNPLLYVPVLWAALVLAPPEFTLVLALLQAMNALLLFRIAERLLTSWSAGSRSWVALACAISGATGATQLGELGATQGDNLVTLPFLGGIALLLAAVQKAREAQLTGTGDGDVPSPVAVWSGLLIGCAVGLKLTMAPFATGAVLAAPLLAGGTRTRMRLALWLGIGAALGFALSAGPWMFEVWRRFGSPVYPMFDSVWPFDGVPPIDSRDPRFLPRSFWSALAYPLVFLNNPRLAEELWFRDIRVPLLFVAAIALPWWRGGFRRQGPVAYLATAMAIGYVLWLGLFGYYRYLTPLEMLAPLLLVLILERVVANWNVRVSVLAFLFLLVAATTRPADWGRAEYGASVLTLDGAEIPPGSAVVYAGDVPLAFTALALGADHDYLRISGSVQGPRLAPWALDWRVARSLDRDARPVYALIQDEPARRAEDYARFGLEFEFDDCRVLHSNLVSVYDQQLRLCPLRRRVAAGVALAEVKAQWQVRCSASSPDDRGMARACRALAQGGGP